jgi:hypothetical protein
MGFSARLAPAARPAGQGADNAFQAWYGGAAEQATPTFHNYFYLFMFGLCKTVVFTATILNAGYLMLDILKFPASEIRKHPAEAYLAGFDARGFQG